MGGLSLWHWIIVIGVVTLLFGGGGKISGIMGDVAKGIKSFKKGMAEDDDQPASPPPAQPVQSVRAEAIEHQADVEIPGAPAAKPRAKTAAKTTAAKKATASRKKADS